jgi:hypothetical protein
MFASKCATSRSTLVIEDKGTVIRVGDLRTLYLTIHFSL